MKFIQKIILFLVLLNYSTATKAYILGNVSYKQKITEDPIPITISKDDNGGDGGYISFANVYAQIISMDYSMFFTNSELRFKLKDDIHDLIISFDKYAQTALYHYFQNTLGIKNLPDCPMCIEAVTFIGLPVPSDGSFNCVYLKGVDLQLGKVMIYIQNVDKDWHDLEESASKDVFGFSVRGFRYNNKIEYVFLTEETQHELRIFLSVSEYKNASGEKFRRFRRRLY
jgi:hypothetical protein